MLKIAVLISGRGSNLRAIEHSIAEGKLPASIEIVVSDQDQAQGLIFASEKGIPTFVSKDQSKIINKLQQLNIQLVCLAGYMKIIGSQFINAFPNRIINIHPSLLPAFPGLNVQQKALEYGVKFSGCTVHFVDEGVDTGPIIMQACVPVLDDDNADSLAARILKEEHRIYSEVIRLIAEDKLIIKGRRVKIKK